MKNFDIITCIHVATHGFIEAAEWANEESENDDGEVVHFDRSDESVASDARALVERFMALPGVQALIAAANDDDNFNWNDLGADIYFSAAGHGVGFHSREYTNAAQLQAVIDSNCRKFYIEHSLDDDGILYSHANT